MEKKLKLREKRLKDYKELLNKYKDNPELAQAFEEFIEYQINMESTIDNLAIENAKELQQKEKDKKRIAYFRHEIINSIGGSVGLAEYLNSHYDSINDEEKKELISDILITNHKTNNLSYFLYSKEVVPRSNFPIQEIALNDAKVSGRDIMEKEKIGIDIYLQNISERPIEIYAHRADFEALLGTLLSNSISWAPKFSRIKEAFRVDKGNNLEILFENKTSPIRLRERGMGIGYGTQMVKDIVTELGGEFHNYFVSSQILDNISKSRYSESRRFGYDEAIDEITKEDSIYGIQVKIPMKNISKE